MARREEVGIDMVAKDLATREIQSVGRSLEGMTRNAESANKSMGFLGNAITGVFQGLGQQIFQKMQQGLAMLGDMAIGFNAKMEQARIGFTTMLGSAQKAEKFIDELLDFSKATPFQFEGLQKSANLIMAMGFEAKEVIPLLTAAGDAVAALGAGEDAVFRVVYALGQMRAAGRVTGQDMMQLASIGIPAWKMLADSMGLTVQQAKLMAEQGKIDAETAIKAITTAIEEGNMGGMMAAQSQTFEGAMSTVKDSVTILISSAFKPFFDVISAGTLAMANFLSTEKVTRFTAQTARAMTELAESIGDVLSMMMPLVEIWLENIEYILPALILLISVQLTKAMIAFASSAKGAALAMMGIKVAAVAAIPFIGEIVDGFNQMALEAHRGGQFTRAEMLAVAEVARRANSPVVSWTMTFDTLSGVAEELGMTLEQLSEQIVEVADRTGMSSDEALYYIRNLESGMGSLSLASEEALEAWRESFAHETEEVTFLLKTFTETLPEYMVQPITEIMEQVRTLPNGMALTLADGTTMFGASAEALARQLPKKMEEARLAAIMEARRVPMELGGAILATIDDWDEAITAIGEAWQIGLTRQAMEANAMGYLLSQGLIDGLNSNAPAVEAAVLETMTDSLATLQSLHPDWFTEGGAIPDNIIQGMLPGLREAAELGDQNAIDIIAKYDAHHAAMAAAGARVGHGLYEGLDPALVSDAPKIETSVTNALHIPLPLASSWGKAITDAWMTGMIGGISGKMYALQMMMGSLKKVMEGSSPPPEGPLKNVDEGGFNIGVAWMEGIIKGIGQTAGGMDRAMGHLMPSEIPSPSMAGGGIGAGGTFGGGGSPMVTINNYYGADSVRTEQDISEISRQTAERVRLLGVGLAQGQVGAIS